MKKTLIALVALSGLAMADAITMADFNTTLSDAITTSGYTAGNEYEISFTIDTWGGIKNTDKGVLTLGTSESPYYLITQNQGQYLGLGTTVSDAPAGTGTFTFEDHTMTQVNADTLVLGWVTRKADGTNSEGRGSNNKPTITLAYDGANTTLTLNHSASSTVDKVVYIGNAFDLNNVKLMGNADTKVVLNTMTVTPEPATATLSLLALAGLAARRRRH